MPKIVKCLLICLTVIAVGLGQVVGLRAGFLCGCTGERVEKADCAASECHSHDAHECRFGGNVATSAGESQQTPLQGGHDDHKHTELRKSLVVTSFPPALSLPPPALFDLPVTYEMPDFSEMLALQCPCIGLLEPPEYGSPPMSQLVAQTIVMLV